METNSYERSIWAWCNGCCMVTTEHMWDPKEQAYRCTGCDDITTESKTQRAIQKVAKNYLDKEQS